MEASFPDNHAFESLLCKRVAAVTKLYGGRNSRVYRVITKDGTCYAGKHYYHSPTDPRDRLGNEFKALAFLWDNGIRNIPRPIARDADCGLAVYAFVEGEKLTGNRVTPDDVDQLVAFVRRLKKLGSNPDSRTLPLASDACLSGAQVIKRIEARLARFSQLDERMPLYDALNDYLRNRFQPAFERCGADAVACLTGAGISFEKEITLSQRILSPSDFGFHNTLKRPDGTLVALDLEYFGWDDPAKLINDFMLHPSIALPQELRLRFQDGTREIFKDQVLLEKRITGLRPLFCLNWCLILLNEFLDADAGRRRFATGADPGQDTIRAKQMQKAEQMLAMIAPCGFKNLSGKSDP